MPQESGENSSANEQTRSEPPYGVEQAAQIAGGLTREEIAPPLPDAVVPTDAEKTALLSDWLASFASFFGQ